MTVYFDTNVLVAAVLAKHPHHGQAAAMLRRAERREIRSFIAAHGLAEFYAALTRIPIAPPVYPSEAWQILEKNVFPYFEIASLSAVEYRQALRACAAAGWTGGRIYDALHLAVARKTGCKQIWTFNVSHFRELAPDLADRVQTP